MNSKLFIYNANGNIIGIKEVQNLDTFKENQEQIAILVETGRAHDIDTIMVIQKSRHTDFHCRTLVFEPSAGEQGSWSTMCGNGVRAIAAHLNQTLRIEHIVISTPAGKVTVACDNDSYSVDMGKLYFERDLLRKYITNGDIFSGVALRFKSAPRFIAQLFDVEDIALKSTSIGFTSSLEDLPDGEPHLALHLEPNLNLESLREIAQLLGPILTNNFEAFPLGINANFYSVQDDGSIHLVTHERNLGLAPNHAITQSCGTGSTMVGGLFLIDGKSISVHSMGGILQISRKGQRLFMAGGAFYYDEVG